MIQSKLAKSERSNVGGLDPVPQSLSELLAPKPSRRIILLTGESQAEGSHVRMDGTIFVAASGAAVGEILWTNIKSRGWPANLAGTEHVRGNAESTRIEFTGEKIDPPFLLEHYRLVLVGAPEAGIFSGVSSVRSRPDGRLWGAYRMIEQD